MGNQAKQPAKKKSKLRSFLTWVLVIFLSLHLLTDGESTESLMALFEVTEPGYTTQIPSTVPAAPAYLGVSVSDSQSPEGVRVQEVEPEGPAYIAGILTGDIIISLNDVPVTCVADLSAELSGYHAGDRAKITVLRGSDRLVLTVRFQEKPQDVTQETLRPNPSKEPTKETVTPATSAPAVDRLPSVPKDLRSHVYLDARELGYCESLTGDVVITVIFVNDPEASWTSKQMDSAKSDLQAAVSRITSDAKTYGAEVNITLKYKTGTASVKISDDTHADWINSALSSAGLPDRLKINPHLEAAYQVDAAPVIFFANHGGRAKAISHVSGNEYAILYENAHAFYHELSHIFGAKDFYYPDAVEDLADKHLPNSIMVNSADGKMESLTAYLIGWTDTLSSDALNFLNATSYLTYEHLAEEQKKDSYTGYVENFSIGTATYTGYLLDGVRHGQGKWSQNGTVWEGTWVYGELQGSGTYQDNKGNTYVGEFKDSTFHGQGTYTWSHGGYYKGQFKNGQYNGQGILVYKDGARYEGQWVNSDRSGTGTIVYADGSKYEGQWKNNVRHGQGTLIYADGAKYTGQWVDNARSGQGTIVYSNGNTYTGQWSNDKLDGQGIMTYAEGHKYNGTWRNNLYHGKGTFTWANGDCYTGEYVDGYRQGYGVYTWASGNKYEGQFYQNHFHGQGTMTYTNGTVKTGTWDNGKYIG